MNILGNNQNQQNENYPNNNVNPMNQMNQNNIPGQLFQQNFQNFQPNINLICMNLNSASSLFYLINLPIVIPNHKNKSHPLINCKTPERSTMYYNWKCDNCKNKYSFSVPSFLCTSCDYDLCQTCFLNLKVGDISIYIYNLDDTLTFYKDDFSKAKIYKPKIHQHPIVRILREPCFFENKLGCNFCEKHLEMTEEFYYCSLCNFCVCLKCYEDKDKDKDKDKKFVDNIEYFPNNNPNQ